MSDREQILTNIRRGLNRGQADPSYRADAGAAGPRARLIPRRVKVNHDALVELFVNMATEAAASVESLSAMTSVPAAVAEFIHAGALSRQTVVAPAPQLAALPWSTRPELGVRFGKARGDDGVGVTLAFAGIAETGTLMLVSGAATPTTLNFLPAVHMVVLLESRIVGPYEQAWDLLRSELGGMPRTVNFVTGPSRSGDLEQTLYLGAHGPLQVHILLVKENGPR